MPARFPGVRVRGRQLLQERSGESQEELSVAEVPPPLAVTGLLGVPDGPCGGVFHGSLCVWTFVVPLKLSLSIAPWGPAWSAERGSGIKNPLPPLPPMVYIGKCAAAGTWGSPRVSCGSHVT